MEIPNGHQGPRSLAALVVVLALAALDADSAGAQAVPGLEVLPDTTVMQVVELRDGSTLYGRIVDVGPPVSFRLSSGQILTLEPASIREVRVSAGRVVNGQVWEPDPNPTRLFFMPTARTTPAGSGYFSVYELIIPFLSFSLTDRLMIAGGTPLIGDFDGDRPFWIAPKFKVLDGERAQVAVGLWSISTGDADDGIYSLLFGTGTFGTSDQALTVGLGYGMEGTDFADSPVAVIGGELRVSRRVKLVTENWLFPGSTGFLSAGPRFMGDHLSADVGLAFLIDEADDIVFPLVNFVYSW
ncbi:MAG: hypothetical protein JSU98_00210 [Gemmatimonadales bacterium]|nr:MAG: hypothetical protein JSU98_00210 [Gemmatimonadales bacterium]